MVYKFLRFFLWLPIIASSAQGQEARFSGWFFNLTNVRFDSKWSLHWDGQVRSTDQWKAVGTILLRPGINYHLNKQVTLTLGYALVENRQTIDDVSEFLAEHRIWEQFIGTHRIKNSFIGHRIRLEERSIPVAALSGSELEVADRFWSMRFRYFIRGMIPFQKGKVFSKGTFFALQNEIFFNLTNRDRLNQKYFDQNRFYLALGYRVNPQFDFEIGYMNQYVLGSMDNSVSNHILQLATYIKIET